MFKGLIIILLILKSSHTYATTFDKDNFLNINLDTKHSYHNEEKNVIEWSDIFILISDSFIFTVLVCSEIYAVFFERFARLLVRLNSAPDGHPYKNLRASNLSIVLFVQGSLHRN